MARVNPSENDSNRLELSPSQVFDLKAGKLQSLLEKLRKPISLGKERSQSAILRAKQVISGEQHQHLREKIAFVLGVANIFITAMCLTSGVQWMAYWYTIKWVVMISSRAIQYRKKLYHYFLFDFCYYGNILMLSYVWLFPTSSTLFLIAFAFANGPLAFAVPLWKNALVFHSLDKLTSCFIHISPGFMSWAFLWRSTNDPWFIERGYQICGLTDQACTVSAFDFLYYGIPVYVIWQVLYLVRVEVFGAKKVTERGYLTSRVYMSKKGFIAILTKKYPSLVGKELILFVGFQFVYTLVTVAPAFLWYHYKALHTGLLAVVALWAAWNGADFYFQIMRLQAEQAVAARYEKKESTQ